ncbi:hypothetical protein JK182_06615 [Acetobacter okinawensis]|uniref:hypothetical protein n=1 Tax=Acetobacter okinawensis TaxID=1076594 RepID=UPI001BAA2A55|nr:hypothetical protein [Acetobacter okinawensis]MBS0988340.1 hypothetical protein [Acetobacter okinawensis]
MAACGEGAMNLQESMHGIIPAHRMPYRQNMEIVHFHRCYFLSFLPAVMKTLAEQKPVFLSNITTLRSKHAFITHRGANS